MEQSFCVLLYSKYSPQCKKLMDGVTTCGFDFVTATGMSSLCIDNKDIRSRIESSNTIEITEVPCILIGYSDGGVEKFEGDTAFEWAGSYIQKLAPPPQPVNVEFTNHPPPPVIEQTEKPKKSLKEPVKRKVVQQPVYEDNESVDEVVDKDGSTNIDDLSTDEEEEPVPIKRPPTALRNGAGNYDLADLGAPIGLSNPKIPEDAITKKRGSLMLAAQEMQKLREKEDENNRPAGMPKEKSQA
jgi:hypothetical protein